MRCIALAQALRRQGVPSVFVTRTAEEGMLARLRREVHAVVPVVATAGTHDAEFTASVARAHDSRWIVVDGYDFDEEYVTALQARGRSVLFIDDQGSAPADCDIVLNQNLHGLDERYELAEHARLLLGPTYALLREEFVHHSSIDVARASSEHPRVLVTLGGADPLGCTLKVVEALATLPLEGTEIRVIVGPAFVMEDGIRDRVARSAHPDLARGREHGRADAVGR